MHCVIARQIGLQCFSCDFVKLFTRCNYDPYLLYELHIAIAQNGYGTHSMCNVAHTSVTVISQSHHMKSITDIHTTHFYHSRIYNKNHPLVDRISQNAQHQWVSGPRGVYSGGSTQGGVCSRGRCLLLGDGIPANKPPPPVDRMTDTCKNITFAKERLRAVKIAPCERAFSY